MATSATKKHSLGIDIGSVSYGYVLMDQKEQIIQSDYRIHNGNILDLLKEQLAKIDLFRFNKSPIITKLLISSTRESVLANR
jgi:activator of 2-hydroxyglutaryl-CoA dehydratase